MDKVVGRALLDGLLPLRGRILCVSGRLSFELVQKAAVAGAPILVGVGAPSSLAIELARDRGMTLAGFARAGRGERLRRRRARRLNGAGRWPATGSVRPSPHPPPSVRRTPAASASRWRRRSWARSSRVSTRRSSTSRCPSIQDDLGGGLAGPAVGRERVPADARLADPHRRLARRHLRRAAGLLARRRRLRRRVAAAARWRRRSRCSSRARALQGVFGALLTPSALAVIVATFPPAERGAAIGSWTAWSGIAMVVGPFVGGWLVDAASWRWIFLINVPFVLATLAARPRRGAGARPRPTGRGARSTGWARRSVRARPRRAGLRADPPAGRRLGLAAGARPAARRGRRLRAVPAARGAHAREPMLPLGALPPPQLRRGQRPDVLDVRRPGRRLLPARPLPPAGRRATTRCRRGWRRCRRPS